MDMTARMREEIRSRKAAQAAAGLSVVLAGELRQLSGKFAAAVRSARLHDAGAVRGKAVSYAGRAGAAAARTYDHLAARGRDVMAGKGH